MGHTLMRILAAGVALAALTAAAAWWLRAWAQYNADETIMDAAMHARSNWDSGEYTLNQCAPTAAVEHGFNNDGKH